MLAELLRLVVFGSLCQLSAYSTLGSCPYTSDMSSLASTSYDSTSMADSVFYNLPSDSDLRAEFIRFNEKHHAIKRVSVEYFVFLVPGLQHELLPAALVRMFADFNVTLITGEGIPPYIPAYYNYYAQALNDHDKSGNGWCYLQPGPHSTRLIFPDILLPADAASFLVRDHEITTRYLAPDMVAVSTFYYENAERLAQQELRRSVRYAKLRQEKKLLGKGKSFSVLDSQEAKARFAVKRKALDDAAAAADAADLRENGPEEGQIVPEVVMGITEPLILPEAETNQNWNQSNVGELLPNSFDSRQTPGLRRKLWTKTYELQKAWLAQANRIFTELEDKRCVENYVCVDYVHFSLRIVDMGCIPEGYLFPVQLIGPSIHLVLFALPRRMPEFSGFPAIHTETVIGGDSWDGSVYQGLLRFHESKRFDPNNREVARQFGYPLFEVLSDLGSKVPFPAHCVEKWRCEEEEDPVLCRELGHYL
ncbi:hypothetical protein MSAN_01504600 [Mycena sanguinolenta]|uniref:Uncharacterized protein n=1 Tax=Mycena sanguinolenta TaxID=230812 RepID=A0A8H7CWR5_9AGAR|nr:hypothetical protein MSAN_01504600 [Mycena sanguinolenta]